MVTTIKFTKTALMSISIPTQGQVEVADSEFPGLRCRISPAGTRTMFLYRKVCGRPTRKTLGRYLPGKDGETVDNFRDQARAEHVKIKADPVKWFEGDRLTDAQSITLEKAFELTLAQTKRGEMSRRDWNASQQRFLDWMKKHYSYVTTWALLRRVHVREYLASQKPTEIGIKRGVKELSPTRLRIIMQPVSQTARYMWLEHEIGNVAERLGISAKLHKTPPMVYIEDVAAFLQFLRAHNDPYMPMLEAGASLAALCGLSVLEVLRLTWNKIDLNRGLLEVSGEVKNIYRNRVIPMPARCVEALKRIQNAKVHKSVQSVDGGHVILSIDGFPYTGASWENYGHKMRKAFREWHKVIGFQWAPKDLRNMLMTLGALRGFSGDVLEQYCGHAPRTVTARHYLPRLASVGIGEAVELERQMQVFRSLIVDHVDREVEKILSGEPAAKVVEINAAAE